MAAGATGEKVKVNSYPHDDLQFEAQGAKYGFDAVKDVAFGSIAGMIGKIIEYPFDTIKVRLQSQSDSSPHRYLGPLDCFQKSIRNDGALSLYRGLSAPLFGAAVENSSLFLSYRIAQDALRRFYKSESLSLGALASCGAFSGACTSLLLTPIELIKCKMQVPQQRSLPNKPNVISLFFAIYRHHGVFGFWHGQLGTLIRETGGSAAWFGSYEGTKAALHNMHDQRREHSVYELLSAGAIAGMTYNFISYPADTIKSRMQTEEVGPGDMRKQRFWAVARNIWAQQGLRGFYSGCGITVGRAAPSSAIIFTTYEALCSFYK